MRLATFLFLALLTTARAEDRLAVASLSTVLADFARTVGGDRVTVTSIVKPGVDPHEFEPTPGDVKTLSTARIVLASGLGFEGYLGKLHEALPKTTFIEIGEKVKPIEMQEDHDHDHAGHDHHHHGVHDPHWWHSIANAKIAVRTIRDAFIAADPAGAATYKANTSAYLARLDDLAQWTKIQVAQIPVPRRILVTSHDALGYFARDYSFVIHPVEGITTADQPSSKKVRDLIALVRADGVKAVFAENIENPKVLSEITRETGAKLGGTLYADGLGDQEASTYDAMMRHNVSTIVESLK